jgi:2-polyprenyl-3-methyl-5-hydroxy-6-metoxy-1,4-benzoquinol methylase
MKEVKDHYDAVAGNYSEQYDKSKLYDTSIPYPANYFRMQLLLSSFVKNDVKKAIEVGVGDGTPLMSLCRSGIDVFGFDIAKSMVEKAKENAEAHGVNPEQIFLGDIQDPNTYLHATSKGKFDGLFAMGVMPHVQNDDFVMNNMATLLKPGGVAFIEFRNVLFSLFTFNRNTVDFVVNDLLSDTHETFKDSVKSDLESRLKTDHPPVRDKLADGSPGYDAILSKFHNPLSINKLFERSGFGNLKLHWYHYHPAMPYLSSEDPELFRSESVNMENESSEWKGYFLCSAFVVEATKL